MLQNTDIPIESFPVCDQFSSLWKFLVQIFGRTPPNFHRLRKIRPYLYLDAD
jgi:hypothetical protein